MPSDPKWSNLLSNCPSRILIGHVLELAHNKLSHNGISQTYAMLKRFYYWKGMKTSITKHIKNCDICQKRNPQVVPYAKLHFDTATFPMEFISMDLIGEFYPLPNLVISMLSL